MAAAVASAVVWSVISLPHATWVDDGVYDVDDQVHCHDDERYDQQAALDDDVVALGDRVDHPLADPGPGKDRFGQDGARHQRADLQADGGDDGDQRIAKSVEPDDTARRQAFGTGGADIVLAQHLQHRRPRLARYDGEWNRRQHDRRQDQMTGG